MWIIPRGARQFWIVATVATLLVAAAAGVYAYGVRWIVRDWAILSAARADLERSEAARRALGAAERRIAAREQDIATIETSIADPANPLPFIEAVEGLGRRLGVKVELTLASPASAGEADAYLITASGPFPKVATFLERFGSFPFLVTTGDAEIIRTGAAGAGVPLSDEVRLSLAVKILRPR